MSLPDELQEKRIGFPPQLLVRAAGVTFRNGQKVLKRAKDWCFSDQSPPCQLEAEPNNPAYPKICKDCSREGSCNYENSGGCAIKILVGTDIHDGEWQMEFAGYVPKAQEIETEDGGLLLLRGLVDDPNAEIQAGVDWIGSAKHVKDANLGCQVGISIQNRR